MTTAITTTPVRAVTVLEILLIVGLLAYIYFSHLEKINKNQ